MNETDSQLQTPWRALRLFSFYRIILSSFLLVLITTGNLPNPFGIYAPALFSTGVVGHLVAGGFLLLLVQYQHPAFREQVFIQLIIDYVVFGVLMYASGGIGSGIGLLLVMSVAAGSLLLIGRMAYLFAAAGALIILFVELFIFISSKDQASNFTQAGLLGAVLFATAALAHTLAVRIGETEALAARRGKDLASLSKMNARIVQRMRSGLLVLDHKGTVHLANVAATRFLGAAGEIDDTPLEELSPVLHSLLELWRQGDQASSLFHPVNGSVDIQVSFTFLGSERDSDILIFMEDAATLRQKAQHLKLASLGQLTASIAHEIRNPLGAISHAGQLLAESPKLEKEDTRLLQIINDHSSRVNQIIENILQLGRRDDSIPENFLIQPWLEKFVDDFKLTHGLSDQEIIYSIVPHDTRVTMDQSQLYQIVTNLCENALSYSTNNPKIELRCSIREDTDRPCLDIIDQGPGIKEEQAEQIFEPFFTDRTGGTGLGLYIASELCEANQALLALFNNTNEGCVFRVTFAHPDKQIHID